MKKWLARLRSVEDKVERAYVFFNNHFAGFGPACVDVFRGLAGLPPVDFKAIHAPGHGRKGSLISGNGGSTATLAARGVTCNGPQLGVVSV